MSRGLKCLFSLCLVILLLGCSGEPPAPKPQNESTQGLDASKQGSDTNTEKKPASGSDSR